MLNVIMLNVVAPANEIVHRRYDCLTGGQTLEKHTNGTILPTHSCQERPTIFNQIFCPKIFQQNSPCLPYSFISNLGKFNK
jgi:hypothetical protein